MFFVRFFLLINVNRLQLQDCLKNSGLIYVRKPLLLQKLLIISVLELLNSFWTTILRSSSSWKCRSFNVPSHEQFSYVLI